MNQPLCTGHESTWGMNRRRFWNRLGLGLGGIALTDMLAGEVKAATAGKRSEGTHFAPKAKRVIFLFQSGAPSQIDLFDHKGLL